MSTGKLQALAHYIIAQCGHSPERLGTIRLNKVIWFSDVIAYQMRGESITDDTYVKRRLGPVPRRILPALDALERVRAISIREPEAPYDVRLYYSLQTPSQDSLSDWEKRVAQDVLSATLGHTANEISEMTHDAIWHAVAEGEEIPLAATLVAVPREISPEVLSWANGVVNEVGAPRA